MKHDEHCACGHEHSHEHEHHHHDEHCSCGHDHEHHHHHEHCSCGHDHSLEHEHHHHDEHALAKDFSGMRIVFLLENLGCAHCAAKMEEKINKLPEIQHATITFATKQLAVITEHPEHIQGKLQEICASIESEVKVIKKERRASNSENKMKEANSKWELPSILLGSGLFLGGIITQSLSLEWLSLGMFILAYLILGSKVLLDAGKNIIRGQVFDENFLMSIATIGAFAIREYPEAVGVMLFYRIGEYFEEKAVERSRSQIMEAVDLRPEVVQVMQGNQAVTIPSEDALVNDVLLIRPGDRIPLDGTILEGESQLDTSPITGEPVPVSVKAGDSIFSGCVNTSGQLKLRVEKTLDESMVSRILDSVENAAASKPKIDKFITRFAKIYTPFVVLIALATAIIPSLITQNWNYWIYTALTFLVMSCPCALVLSVPLAFFSGIGAGSKKRILFKGGQSMEVLKKLSAVVMDKTGTLTEGNFKLQKVVSSSHYSEDQILALCAGCEEHSTHPIAVSILAAAREKNLSWITPDSMEEIAGHGILANICGMKLLCGNRKLMEKYNIEIPQLLENTYGTEVFLAVNHTFIGYLLISDTIKKDASTAIARLKEMGLHTVMLTGDSEDSANAVANVTGISEVHAKLLPQDKLEILSQIRQKHGSVMFIGDGINDAPVLAGADVSAAMGSGADAAIEAADAVFMTSSVDAIPESIMIARKVNDIAIQNVVFALIVKGLVMILGLFGHANMWMAVFADSGVAMICVLNSIRILYKKK